MELKRQNTKASNTRWVIKQHWQQMDGARSIHIFSVLSGACRCAQNNFGKGEAPLQQLNIFTFICFICSHLPEGDSRCQSNIAELIYAWFSKRSLCCILQRRFISLTRCAFSLLFDCVFILGQNTAVGQYMVPLEISRCRELLWLLHAGFIQYGFFLYWNGLGAAFRHPSCVMLSYI